MAKDCFLIAKIVTVIFDQLSGPSLKVDEHKGIMEKHVTKTIKESAIPTQLFQNLLKILILQQDPIVWQLSGVS